MAMSVLEKDVNIHFPHFTVLKASAGSGKTYTLTERFVQFLLSEKIPHNRLRNILAITFSNNASKEMKERVLEWLKSLYFEDPRTVEELAGIVTMERPSLVEKAGRIIDTILSHYADFQVRTIDSFMATIFRSSAIDFGYAPDFEILMNSDPILEYAFNLYLKEVKEGSIEAGLFEKMIQIMTENKKGEGSYLWDPSALLQEEMKRIYKKIAASGRSLKIRRIFRTDRWVEAEDRSGARKDREAPLESPGSKETPIPLSPVFFLDGEETKGLLISLEKGLRTARSRSPESRRRTFKRLTRRSWIDGGRWGRLIQEYTFFYARSYYTSYLKLYETLSATIEEVKKRQGKVFIEDINKRLSEYLQSDIVPGHLLQDRRDRLPLSHR